MKWHSFSEVVTDVTSKFKKIKAKDYCSQGRYKIIDQGKEPIAGYTDDDNLIKGHLLPVVIFGDHTRVLKYVDEPIALGADGAKALFVNPSLANAHYIYYYLRSIQIKEAGYSRHFKFLKEIEIPIPFKDGIPDFDEQIQIAHLLGKVEGLIAQRRQYLKQLDDLLKSVFQEMFGDPVKNDKGWDKGFIADYCEVKGGKRIPKGEKLVEENTGFPYIKAGNIKNGEVTMDDLEFVTPEVRKSISRYTVDEGDVCITVVGANIGDIGIVPTSLHKASLTENANKLLIKDKQRLNNHYLAQYMASSYVQQQIASNIRVAGVPKLAIFRIEQMLILIPPPDQQVKFEKTKKRIQQLTSHYQYSLTELESLYGVLSQQAFRGELDLSRIKPSTQQIIQCSREEQPLMPTPNIEEISPIELPETDFLISALESPENLHLLLHYWLEAYLAQLGKTAFSVERFIAAAQNRLAESHPDNEFELGADEYEHIKSWVFDVLSAGKLIQVVDEVDNSIHLKVM